jgi:hyaluronate lyase
VTYTPRIQAGSYEVFLRWPAAASHSASVPVDIAHAGGITPVAVNQQANGGQWVSLGVYTFNAGTAGYVRISNAGTTGTVCADAVKFVRALDDNTDQAKLANGLASWRKTRRERD